MPPRRPPVLPPRAAPVPPPVRPPVLPPAAKPKAPVAAAPNPPASIAPKPARLNVAAPSHFRRGLAGVELSAPPGPGEAALDAACAEKDLVWGLVHTFDRDGQVSVLVLVGSLFEASVPLADGNATSKVAWNLQDEAMAVVARHLRGAK